MVFVEFVGLEVVKSVGCANKFLVLKLDGVKYKVELLEVVE